ncbi:MAG: hypothetical protein RBR35_14885 [Salinivirgaceae bacterium]|nr:hypothetical protein [Salinivirgaceae bacterium]
MFANRYLLAQNKIFIKTLPDEQLSGLVVIPCYSEPDIFKTLDSLRACNFTCVIEVIVVVNYPETVNDTVTQANKSIFEQLEQYSANYSTHIIQFKPIWLGAVRKKFAGAGYARKIGMDEAVYRLNAVNNGNGFIASLDGDTLVEPNYISELESVFHGDSKTRQVVVPFCHPKEGVEVDLKRAITLYELYMRYFRLAMEHIGWPWSYHTVGSAFAVRASVYVEQGGMNKKNAGEDFYFLNKLFPLGGTEVLKNTMVYPAARLSARVPFGTGPAMKQIIESHFNYEVYTLHSILDIQYFIDQHSGLYNTSETEVEQFMDNAPGNLSEFWKQSEFKTNVLECNSKSASKESFQKHLFRKFDAFQIVKYLNFAHEKHYVKSNVEIEFKALLTLKGMATKLDTAAALLRIAETLDY